MKPRSIVYVDGFNLYYGSIKGGPNKWLNLERYFTLLRQGDDVQRIHYFTAMVSGPHVAHQEVYLRALETLPRVNIVLGYYKFKSVTCGVQQCTFTGRRRFRVPEEKHTDVNIAVQMMDDAYQDCCDIFVLVSGDSDLVPAVNRVKSRFPDKRVAVYVPSRDLSRGAAVELRSAADTNKTLPLALLKRAQFPARMPDGSGGFITKPAAW